MLYLITFAALVLCLCSLMPYLPFSAVWTDMPSHFTLQFFIAAALLAVLALVFKTPLSVNLAIALALLLPFFQLLPLLPYSAGASAEAAHSFKILQVNVLKTNKETAPLGMMIRDENPDIVVAAEVTPVFAHLFQEMKSEYPYQQIIANDTSFGMAVLSKKPFERMQQENFDSPLIPALSFTLKINGQDVDFLSLHAANPTKDFGSRDREFAGVVSKFGAHIPKNFVVLGDMNATPYCPALKSMTRGLHLRNARKSRGIGGTYPVWLPTPLLKMPIDQVLVSDNIDVIDFRIGDDVGSDHLPTLSLLAVKP